MIRLGVIGVLLIAAGHAFNDTDNVPCVQTGDTINDYNVPNMKDTNEKQTYVRLGDITQGKWTILTNVANF
jgi:hypothetical protein